MRDGALSGDDWTGSWEGLFTVELSIEAPSVILEFGCARVSFSLAGRVVLPRWSNVHHVFAESNPNS